LTRRAKTIFNSIKSPPTAAYNNTVAVLCPAQPLAPELSIQADINFEIFKFDSS
jgi:hypothetical protein